jgi:hypothetical protein
MRFQVDDAIEQEESLGTVDVWQLRHYRRPFLRILTRSSVAELELNYYLRTRLATGHWAVLRAVLHVQPDGALSTHCFDVYGRPATTRTV